MEQTYEAGSKCNTNSMSKMINWSSESNWSIAHGSLENSIGVESSDYPITEPDPENQERNSPLVLKPLGSDSEPCEIKICLGQKYEISQIYVRSSARVYEVYYAKSPNSSNEYLCTVRCGVAERDEKLLQATFVEDVGGENGGCYVGEVTEEIVTDGGNVVNSDDEWVKIKAPEDGGSFSSNKVNINRVTNVQDLYEATAQISDAEPCSSLTIRLLSLQDRGYVYVDEVYVFVDPVESTDSGTEVPAGNSAQSSLIAMFMPTLMQLTKSSASRVKDKHAPNELHQDDSMETRLRRVDGVDVGLEKNPNDTHNLKMKGLDKDTAESDEIPQPTSTPNSKKCAESIVKNDLPAERLESALEQLISRVSRVEDICLRFEEKILKPIESMEARFQRVEHQLETRLQQVEHQLEKLTKNFQDSGSPHCTRISAPAFSCSESNSSSLYNEGRDYTPSGVPETEKKDLSSDIMLESYNNANIRPGLVLRAPEFSFNEDEENNDDLKASVDSPCTKPKQSLSIDDALAAALSGFLSGAKIQHCENIQSNSGLSSEADKETQHLEYAESCQIKLEELTIAENCKSESSRYTQILAVTAPDFTVEESGDEDPVYFTQTSSDTASVSKNEEKDHGDERVAPRVEIENIFTSADSSDANINESGDALVSASNHANMDESLDKFVSASNDAYMDENVNEFVSASNHANMDESEDEFDSVSNHDNMDKSVDEFVSASNDTSPVVGTCLDNEHLNEFSPQISESPHVSSLDFEFPILEVNFTSDMHTSTKSPLEALLDGEAESNVEVPVCATSGDDDGNTEKMNSVIRDSNGTSYLLPGDYPLLDLGFSSADGSSNLENGFHNPCTPSSPEMIASLI